jgi:hypothetical protein
MLTVLSTLPEATRLSCRSKSAHHTSPLCPVSVLKHRCFFRSHIFTTPSPPALTRKSSCALTDQTAWVCAEYVLVHFPVFRSQILIDLSSEELNRRVESNRTLHTVPKWPSNENTWGVPYRMLTPSRQKIVMYTIVYIVRSLRLYCNSVAGSFKTIQYNVKERSHSLSFKRLLQSCNRIYNRILIFHLQYDLIPFSILRRISTW